MVKVCLLMPPMSMILMALLKSVNSTMLTVVASDLHCIIIIIIIKISNVWV